MIASVWFAVIGIKLIMLSFDLYTLQRLKVVRVRPLEAGLLQRVNHLAGELGIKKMVLVLQSGIVNAPLIIGYLKPVILIPAGMIARVTPEDLEAILLHELAHIRRMDYLVNIFLRIAAILLFFNPAVLWVSSLIREERENCCDDLVIRMRGDRIGYIRALVQFEEQRAPSYAMAIGGSGILPRVQRLAAGYSRTLNRVELFVLTVLLVLTCFFVGRPSLSIAGRASPLIQAVPPHGGRAATPDGGQAAEMEAKLRAEARARAHP
jgi:beta-lactamase regulating signal transducer with metallopeptidase domain